MREYDDKHYQDFEYDPAKMQRGIPAEILELQKQNISKREDVDNKISQLLSSQDTDTKQHIYNVIREIVAIRQQSNSALSAEH
ncbi:MAG: hypothetical protein KGV56_02670 [Gammaproteobacteria bacterium]|nr:hypothetical protein [Gammaproteobacteria bacterium]